MRNNNDEKTSIYFFLSVLNTLCVAINYSRGNYGNIVINIIALVACLVVLRGEKDDRD